MVWKKSSIFAAERNDQTIYIQATYLVSNEEVEKREFGNLQAIHNNYPKMVISLNPLNTNSNIDGIAHVHLREFLKQTEF